MTLTADNIAGYAQTLVLQARSGGVELDSSLASIVQLEALLLMSDPLLALPQFPQEQRNLLIFYVGCYLGETLARCHGGVWQFAHAWWESSLTFVRADGRGVQLYPFEKVRRRVTEPAANDLVVYADELAAQLPC